MPELTKLLLEPLPNGTHWRVHQSWRYRLADGREHTVPEDRVTDLASTPQIVWNLYPPFGKYTRAAVLHDDIYKTGRIAGVACSRHEADDILREVMAEWGCEPEVCDMFHNAVRVGAGDTWERYREEDAQC